jgi:hypothetical protein
MKTALALTLLAVLPALARAQERSPEDLLDVADSLAEDVPLEERRALAARLAGPPLALDGRLDEAAWLAAEPVTGFAATRASEQTEVRFLYDDGYLYVGARMRTADPTSVRALVGRRDRVDVAESFAVSLDTYRDRRTAYTFEVTAGGVRADYVHPEDRFGSRDYTWDPVWEARVARDAEGWTAEMRIPFSQLRFADADGWGLNAFRRIPAQNRISAWIRVRRQQQGWASRFGELGGLEGVRPTLGLELVPYVAGESEFRERALDDPFKHDPELQARAGADLRARIGGATLDATFNPDFGQVEADPAVVNLTAFETFFPEKRPFFLRTDEDLSGRGPRLFYSRRIGATPRGAAAGDVVDRPDRTSILGAAKIHGRTPRVGGTALVALTSREEARVFDRASGAVGEVDVEPRTLFAVGRVERLGGRPASSAGATVTLVQRDFAGATPLERLLARRAVAGGGDFLLRPEGSDLETRGYFGVSHVQGDSAAMRRLQLSSARYYQRPDADHVDFVPSRTALSGYTAGLTVRRVSGRLQWHARGAARSPGFEINDAGILGTADRIEAGAGLDWSETIEASWLRRYDLSLFASGTWNYGGDRQYAGPGAAATLVWPNWIRTFADVTVETEALSDKQTRGGPLMETPRAWNAHVGVNSDYGATLQWYLDASHRQDDLAGGVTWGGGGISVQGGPRLRLSLDAGYTRTLDTRQFFDAIPGGRLGTRWIFATVDHRTLYAQLRFDLAVSPDQTIELYVEPFASSGRFGGFGELVAARTSDLRIYGTDGTTIVREPDGSWTVTTTSTQFPLDDRDFDVRSFRSNLVWRWEWRRGSTLYVIWQRDRFGDEEGAPPLGGGTFAGALGESLTAEDGGSTLAVKLSYWFPID